MNKAEKRSAPGMSKTKKEKGGPLRSSLAFCLLEKRAKTILWRGANLYGTLTRLSEYLKSLEVSGSHAVVG